jgi:pyruvate/2-oxoacid:ferredoxin oxidoreductase alpha subunit
MPNKQNRKIMAEEVVLMKGNEAIAHAAIRIGVDGYFGYPITPQSEVLETLAEQKPWETTGMVVLQAESEVAAINMVYGGAGSGKMVMTSSSSPGVSLKQEGISYIAGAELPCLVVNVMRGGPGLGTIQPSQADYFQTTKGGGHGDYHLIALAPASVQEMADFVGLAFDLAFKYRNPAMILADGVIGQMMEKVVLPEYRPRRTEEEILAQCPWATTGCKGRKPNIITSLELDPAIMYIVQHLGIFAQVTKEQRVYRTQLIELTLIKCKDYFQHIIRAGSNLLHILIHTMTIKTENFQQKFFFISKQFIKRTLGYRKRTCYIVHVDSLNPQSHKRFGSCFHHTQL